MRQWEGKGVRCECRGVDKGGEKIAKGRQSGERWGLETEEEQGKDIWGENDKDGAEGEGRLKKGTRWRFSRKGKSHEEHRREQEERTMCAALVFMHVIRKAQLQSIYDVQPFKCVISSF